MAALKRELDGRAIILVAGIIGILGAAGTVAGCLLEPRRAFAAYLAAWTTIATIAAGGAIMLLIGYAANARWPAAIRRMTEAIAAGLPAVAVLAIPLYLFPDRVWPWVDNPPNAYLSVPFFTIRGILYMAILIVPCELLLRWSRRRDDQPEPQVPHGTDRLDRERVLSCAVLPAVGLALTFASFDWLMSLQPGWWSSGFGLYVICGALFSGLALTVVLAWRGVATGAVPLTPNHFHAMGRLLHAYIILWAYIAYFQAMLIQIANRPDEATFYLDRAADGWRFVSALLVILTFALPFPLLFPRRLKRRPAYVGGIAIMLLVAHYLDLWWLVIPRVSASPIPSWTDLAAIAAVGGLTTAVAAFRTRGVPLLPVGDPYLARGLSYETTT